MSMYPSEETALRNRWQAEYDAQTREQHQSQYESYMRPADDDAPVPSWVAAEFEDWS